MSYRPPRLFTFGALFRLPATAGLGVILYLSAQGLQHPAAEPPALPVAAGHDWHGRLIARSAEVTAALERLPLPIQLPPAVAEAKGSGAAQWTHRRYELVLPKPGDLEALEASFSLLDRQVPDVVVQHKSDSSGAQVAIGIEGLRTHTIQLIWLERPPRVAIIITDLGEDLLAARDLLSHNIAVSYAVLPFLTFSQTVAERLRLAGAEVLVDLKPSEADGNARRDDSPATLVERSASALPAAVGVYHRRRAPAEEPDHALLNQLQAQHLFLIEGASQKDPCSWARKATVPCASVAVELNDPSPESVGPALDRLELLAQTQGDAVGTLSAPVAPLVLADLTTRLQSKGIQLVPASHIVAEPSLSPR